MDMHNPKKRTTCVLKQTRLSRNVHLAKKGKSEKFSTVATVAATTAGAATPAALLLTYASLHCQSLLATNTPISDSKLHSTNFNKKEFLRIPFQT